MFSVQSHAGQQGAFFMAGFEPIIPFEFREPERFAAVEGIPHNPQSGIPEMHANLVRPVGQRLTVNDMSRVTPV